MSFNESLVNLTKRQNTIYKNGISKNNGINIILIIRIMINNVNSPCEKVKWGQEGAQLGC